MKKTNKNSGFKVPEDYLDTFNDNLLNKIASEDQPSIPKNESFKIPDGYFNSLHKNITSKLDEKPAKVITLKSYKKYYYSAIAVAAVLLLFFTIQPNKPNNININDLASSEIDAYFEDTDLGLSTYEIAEVIPVDDLELNDVLETTINDEDIVNYLDDNTDYINELNIESDEY